ncbi:putative mitochondrial protein, partial [Tanacetum coccineum]
VLLEGKQKSSGGIFDNIKYLIPFSVKCKNAARNMEKDLKCNVIRILRDFTELTTPFQVKWLAKLLGFDCKISYNKGTEKVVADALSRLTSGEIIQKLTNGTQTGNKYVGEGSVLKREGKVTVGADEQLRSIIVQHYYVDAVGGHSGTNVVAHKVGTLFYWKGLVKRVIRECDVCQRQKAYLAAYTGLLQPLPILKKVWSEISMDSVVVGLPKSQGKTMTFVV